MSKSLKRVITALESFNLEGRPIEMPGETRTAQQAADAVGCALDQIAKSIIFGCGDGCALFLTAGGRQVCPDKATALAAMPLTRADANTVRKITGFAIGGVAPVGHVTQSPVWMDRRLLDFTEVWAAAGTPRHVFPINPMDLQLVTGATVADFTSS
ncbi:aminoacyl-tRNA deacylase [Jannaschia pagri]|uniref:Aminoacyl-tRNA deacylase n=1 Tax=Jannaschia pagri TaxID=2829797 RepID=A0ABQ4NNU6_9RHOB|nr:MULTISPECIES: YbaK/EbsC family protein [unclassified Jannaschia]GIT92236.1 aminoacyl-tRNA deacylase [Jannaschia sp. AI_61]GIT96070.1 aminoacyl-tRNA deacylase [Jannaschia sp. AI_62]